MSRSNAHVSQPDLFAAVYAEERRVWWILPKLVGPRGWIDAPERQPYEGIRCSADYWYFPTFREGNNVGWHIHELYLSDEHGKPARKWTKGLGVMCSQWWSSAERMGSRPGHRCSHGAEGGGFNDYVPPDATRRKAG